MYLDLNNRISEQHGGKKSGLHFDTATPVSHAFHHLRQTLRQRPWTFVARVSWKIPGAWIAGLSGIGHVVESYHSMTCKGLASFVG